MKVQIKKWDEMEKEYGAIFWTEGKKRINVPHGFYSPTMIHLCGEIINLSFGELLFYKDSDDNEWVISREMFHCLEDCKTCVWKFHKNLTRECKEFYKPIKK
jgi:hypothetical protein